MYTHHAICQTVVYTPHPASSSHSWHGQTFTICLGGGWRILNHHPHTIRYAYKHIHLQMEYFSGRMKSRLILYRNIKVLMILNKIIDWSVPGNVFSLSLDDSLHHLAVCIPLTFIYSHHIRVDGDLLQMCCRKRSRHGEEKMHCTHKPLSVKHSLFKCNRLWFYRAKTGGWAVEMGGTHG